MLDGTDKADEMYLRLNKLESFTVGNRARARAVGLQYLEEFLQLNHQLPVGLDEVIAEVIFARVDTGARYLEQYEIDQFTSFFFFLSTQK